eukprot:6063565-Amphidinium_carterae.1
MKIGSHLYVAAMVLHGPSGAHIGKQTPPIVAQLDEVHSTKELRLRNNEDEQEKHRMESIMDNILVQPWWQYEDKITKYEVKNIENAMNKEMRQLDTKKSSVEVDSSSLSAEQLSKVVGTRWVINDRPSSNGGREVKCSFCAKGFTQSIDDKDVQ